MKKWIACICCVVLLGLSLEMKAHNSAGELAACIADCDEGYYDGLFYCNFLFGEERTFCFENNEAGLEACQELCHINHPGEPGE